MTRSRSNLIAVGAAAVAIAAAVVAVTLWCYTAAYVAAMHSY